MKTKRILFTTIVVTVIGSFLILQSCKRDNKTTPATGTPASAGTPGLSPTKVQRPLVFLETAVWCGYCPGYGDVPMKQIVEQYPNAIGIALHQTDYLSGIYPIAGTFSGIFDNTISGIPCFNVDNMPEGEQLPASVIQSEQAKTPVAGVGNYWTKSTKYNIQARVKFYSASTGTYYLGVYAIQNGIDAVGANLFQHDYLSILSPTPGNITLIDTCKWTSDQASYTNKSNQTAYWFQTGQAYTDDYVATASADSITSPWGQQLNGTSFSANDSITANFTITPNNTWITGSNVKIVAILWQYSNGTYSYVNGFEQ
jgi:hypothetical protein